ncbi:MAG: hypothetical protein HZA95_01020 [Candidatus Vogelbacteria bacterium]|nr:hypothetical protein [Candidatus Vogelbacteria bacterium]
MKNKLILAIALILSIFCVSAPVSAWTGPTAQPPEWGDLKLPLNTGNADQIKGGGLQLGTSIPSNSSSKALDIVNGLVRIGSISTGATGDYNNIQYKIVTNGDVLVKNLGSTAGTAKVIADKFCLGGDGTTNCVSNWSQAVVGGGGGNNALNVDKIAKWDSNGSSIVSSSFLREGTYNLTATDNRTTAITGPLLYLDRSETVQPNMTQKNSALYVRAKNSNAVQIDAGATPAEVFKIDSLGNITLNKITATQAGATSTFVGLEGIMVKGTNGLCIGADCRTSWAGAGGSSGSGVTGVSGGATGKLAYWTGAGAISSASGTPTTAGGLNWDNTNNYLTIGGGILSKKTSPTLGDAAFGVWSGANLGGTHAKFLLMASDGKMWWGDGGNSLQDTNLYRTVADTLKTDDNFQVGGNLRTTGKTTTTGGLIIEYRTTSQGDPCTATTCENGRMWLVQ